MVATYQHRKSRGQVRATYNEGVSKIPGIYNQDGKIVVSVANIPNHFMSESDMPTEYDFLNLTANARTQALQEQYEIIEEVLKKQLKVD